MQSIFALEETAGSGGTKPASGLQALADGRILRRFAGEDVLPKGLLHIHRKVAGAVFKERPVDAVHDLLPEVSQAEGLFDEGIFSFSVLRLLVRKARAWVFG